MLRDATPKYFCRVVVVVENFESRNDDATNKLFFAGVAIDTSR